MVSFSPTAKFKDRVEILSNLAKAKAETLEGQGSQPGECRKSQQSLPCFALQALTFPAHKAQGLAKKPWGLTHFVLLLGAGGCCNSAAEINRCRQAGAAIPRGAVSEVGQAELQGWAGNGHGTVQEGNQGIADSTWVLLVFGRHCR